MLEFSIRLADLCIRIHAEYGYTRRLCADYLCPDDETPDFSVSVTPAEIERERCTATPAMSDGYLESICLYRAICRQAPLYGVMLLHAAVIADGCEDGATEHADGYAFTADSGTGKTTHIRLWRRTFGECVRIINGDKPLLRRRGDTWYAYGTPWCGKEGWHVNASVPLRGICFLRRGETDTIRAYPAAEAVPAIFPQIVLPEDPIAMAATLELLDKLVTEVPLYELHCTISDTAARVAREGMKPCRG